MDGGKLIALLVVAAAAFYFMRGGGVSASVRVVDDGHADDVAKLRHDFGTPLNPHPGSVAPSYTFRPITPVEFMYQQLLGWHPGQKHTDIMDDL